MRKYARVELGATSPDLQRVLHASQSQRLPSVFIFSSRCRTSPLSVLLLFVCRRRTGEVSLARMADDGDDAERCELHPFPAAPGTKVALHGAVEAGHLGCLRRLISRSAVAHHRDKRAWPPLATVLERVDARGCTALHLACHAILRGAGGPVTVTGYSALETLLEAGADAGTPVAEGSDDSAAPDTDPSWWWAPGVTPLLLAARSNAHRLAVTLLDSSNGSLHPEATVQLLGDDFDVATTKDDCAGFTALHFAARRGNVALTNALAAVCGTTVVRDGAGRTPLHVAAAAGKTDACRALLAEGANVNEPVRRLQSEVGDAGEDETDDVSKSAKQPAAPRVTPLTLALERGRTTTAAALCELGAQ